MKVQENIWKSKGFSLLEFPCSGWNHAQKSNKKSAKSNADSGEGLLFLFFILFMLFILFIIIKSISLSLPHARVRRQAFLSIKRCFFSKEEKGGGMEGGGDSDPSKTL